MNGCFVILMTANDCFAKKHSIISTFKMQVLVSEVYFVKRKKILSFEISRYLFVSHEVNMPYLN